MKQFVYGNARQFESLYDQLSGESRKKVWFTVTFPDEKHARLGFQCVNGHMSVELNKYGDESMPDYQGDNELFRKLVTERHIEFENKEQMLAAFQEARCVYERRARRNYFSSNGTLPETERIEHVPTAVDSVKLANDIKSRIIGQDAQVEGIAKCVCNHLRKKKPKKPLVIMLPGPTGVGKTATAQELTERLQAIFGKDEFPLIYVKCNEFKESYRISQLTGSPQGYVGHDESCMMSVAARTGRFVLLLDEFEKLHPDIATAVMQWMDTGKVTLSRIENGRDTADYDCRGSIFILTSNIDMRNDTFSSLRFIVPGENEQTSQTSTAISSDDSCRRIMVNNGFKPEIAGRISRFFEFKRLTKNDIAQIAVLVFKSKFAEYGFIVDAIESELLEDIQSHYTSSQFGVRPLENALEEVLGSQLPPPSVDEPHITVGGTVEHLIITEV